MVFDVSPKTLADDADEGEDEDHQVKKSHEGVEPDEPAAGVDDDFEDKEDKALIGVEAGKF